MDYDFDGEGDWGYNGDAEHDMWVDYTTDMYDDTDYSGENPDYDGDCDAEYERRIHHLEMLIAAALASAATLDTKSANASTAKNIRKYQRRASEKQSEAMKYQEELDKLTTDYAATQLQAETKKTRIIIGICVAVSALAILFALLH